MGLAYELQWRSRVTRDWRDSETFAGWFAWRRACRAAARRIANTASTPDWRVIQCDTGRVVLALRRYDAPVSPWVANAHLDGPAAPAGAPRA